MKEKIASYDCSNAASYRLLGRGQEAVFRLSVEAKRAAMNKQRAVLEDWEVETVGYRRVIELAKEDLRQVYARVGVIIESVDFPDLFLIPERYKKKLIDDKRWAGSFGGSELAAVVYVSGRADDLYDIETIHHELNHGLGRTALVSWLKERYDEAGKKAGYTYGTQTAQTGHQTWNRITDETRGKLLEEGVVDYCSRRFMLFNDQSEVMDARRKFCRGLDLRYLLGVKQEMANKLVRHYFSWQEMKKRECDYALAIRVVERLLERAGEVYGDEGRLLMEARLLRSRIYPSERRQLADLIDELYPKGWEIFQNLYRIGVEYEEVEKLLLRL